MKKNSILFCFFIGLLFFFIFNNNVYAEEEITYKEISFKRYDNEKDLSFLQKVCGILTTLPDVQDWKEIGNNTGFVGCKYHFNVSDESELEKEYSDIEYECKKNKGCYTTKPLQFADIDSNFDKIDSYTFAFDENNDVVKDEIQNLIALLNSVNQCGDKENESCTIWAVDNLCASGKKVNNDFCTTASKSTASETACSSDENVFCCSSNVPTYHLNKDKRDSFKVTFMCSKPHGKAEKGMCSVVLDEYDEYVGQYSYVNGNTFNFYSKSAQGITGTLQEAIYNNYAKNGTCDSMATFCLDKDSKDTAPIWWLEANESACSNFDLYQGTSQTFGQSAKFMENIDDINLTSNYVFVDNDLVLCDENGVFLGDEDLSNLIKTLYNVFKILVPVTLLVLGSIDFVKAIFAQDESNIKKAQSMFIKRLIIAVVIFLIPTVLKLILTIAHGIWPVIDATLCGII